MTSYYNNNSVSKTFLFLTDVFSKAYFMHTSKQDIVKVKSLALDYQSSSNEPIQY